jgi:hypothetical protein
MIQIQALFIQEWQDLLSGCQAVLIHKSRKKQASACSFTRRHSFVSNDTQNHNRGEEQSIPWIREVTPEGTITGEMILVGIVISQQGMERGTTSAFLTMKAFGL